MIVIIKTAPWKIGPNIRTFVEGEKLEVGKDVPDKIAEDMLKHDYAETFNGMPKIETKKVETISSEKEDIIDIDSADAEELEIYARDHLGIELDRRKKIGKLRKIVKDALAKLKRSEQ